MASVIHFSILRETITRELGEAIATGVCDTTEALMLVEDVLLGVEDGTDAKFRGADLTGFAEKMLRMAQARPL